MTNGRVHLALDDRPATRAQPRVAGRRRGANQPTTTVEKTSQARRRRLVNAEAGGHIVGRNGKEQISPAVLWSAAMAGGLQPGCSATLFPLNRDYMDAHYQRGFAQCSKGEYDKAISDFDRALELDPGYANAYYRRGDARQSTADYDGAVADSTLAISRNREYADAYRGRGRANTLNGDCDDIAGFDPAVELNGDDASAYRFPGDAKNRKDDCDGAIADFSRAIGIDDEYTFAYLWRGHQGGQPRAQRRDCRPPPGDGTRPPMRLSTQ